MDDALVITLGRADDCTLVFDDPKISGRHARLEPLGDGRCRLTDLGSRNGTFVERDGRLERVETTTTVGTEHRIHFGACAATVRDLLEMAGCGDRAGPRGSSSASTPRTGLRMVRCDACGWVKAPGATCPNPLCGDPTGKGRAPR